MTKPNFQAMTRQELRTYVLEHRDDAVAFRALVDKLLATPPGVTHPAPQAIEDLSNFPDLLKGKDREQEEL